MDTNIDADVFKIMNEGRPLSFPAYGKWHLLREYRGELFEMIDEDGSDIEHIKGSLKEGYYAYLEEYEKNRLAHFLPHGPDKGGGKDFLNDWTNEICLLTAPTRLGKSCHGVAFGLLRTLKCDPDWHLFKHHGIDYHEWRGPRRLIISSYEWTNVQELWDEYVKWIPRKLLGPWAPNYGKYPDETDRPRPPLNLKTGNTSHFQLLDNTDVLFRCDRQSQGPWEGQRWDEGHFDEQRQREKFIGYLRGTDNTPGLVQCCFTLTGHVVDDRPDTGASGWIKRELYDGEYTFGRTIGRYKLDIEHTPSVVLTEKTKARLKKQWVTDPEKNGDEETKRKAQARYFGGWESGAGLVLDTFNPHYHVIPDIDMNNIIVMEATLYRGIDHGLNRPCACVWGMVFPRGDLLIYREYFVKGKTIPYHAEKIVEMSGNVRKKFGTYKDRYSGEAFDRLEEDFVNERYKASVLDSRSFKSPGQETDRPIGLQYNQRGLSCKAAKGWRNERIVPDMKAWLEPVKGRTHIMTEFKKRGIISEKIYDDWYKAREGKIDLAPRIYFVSSLNFTFKEMRQWAINSKTGQPIDKNDHIVGGALKYLIAERPKFWGDPSKRHYRADDTLRVEDVENNEKKDVSPYKYVKGW